MDKKAFDCANEELEEWKLMLQTLDESGFQHSLVRQTMKDYIQRRIEALEGDIVVPGMIQWAVDLVTEAGAQSDYSVELEAERFGELAVLRVRHKVSGRVIHVTAQSLE